MEISKWKARTLATCAVVGTFVGISGAASAGPALELERSRAPVPVLVWESCGGPFECATASVPLDYDQPRGAQTTLALVRVPATDQANKVGTVFVNPGGPGASGVELVLFGFGEELAEDLGGRFDIVGFDPRGVASSDPLFCFDDAEEFEAFFPLDLPYFPYRHDQERAFFDVYRSLAQQCFSRNQPIISHMSTADVVRDLDLLRQAVGDSKLTYLGFSYGSYIGMTYANLFPNKVRALVIDGVLDPRLWSGGRQIEVDRIASGEEFEEFLRLCDEAGDACAFHVAAGSAARYEALASSLHETPLDLGDFLYTYDVFIADITDSLYTPELWGDYAALFDEIADAVLGEPGAAQSAVRTRQALRQRIEDARPQRTDYVNGFDAFYGNHCADTEYPVSLPAYSKTGQFAEEGSRIGPLWWWFNAPCALWPTAQDRYAGPWSTRTSNPVLIVGNFFDGVTGYKGALGSRDLLRNSRLLSYAGWGHTAFGRSECATSYVIDYLHDGSLPPEGTVCPANPNPFLPVSDLQLKSGSRLPLVGLPPPRPAGR